jgi:uncharacterized protein (TIGR01777 family)
MKIIIAGGTGYLGKLLTNHFKTNNKVTIITRGVSKIKKQINYINWNDNWQKELETTDTVINLTGKSINCLFTNKNKEALISSRINATKAINQAILKCENPPKLFINTSGISIYKSTYKTDYNEYNKEFGNDFLSILSQKWETTFYQTKTPKTRKVAIRLSPVIGKNSNIIKTLKPIVKLGLGGKQGNGKQLFPWIHEQDFINSINFIIKNTTIDGSVNLITPKPISNYEFMKRFRKTLNKSIGLPTPTLLLYIAKYFTKVEPKIILTSLYAHPKKLKKFGFKFSFTSIDSALSEILK